MMESPVFYALNYAVEKPRNFTCIFSMYGCNFYIFIKIKCQCLNQKIAASRPLLLLRMPLTGWNFKFQAQNTLVYR